MGGCALIEKQREAAQAVDQIARQALQHRLRGYTEEFNLA